MNIQNSLQHLLERMKSSYIPEHTAAADEFLRQGYPAEILKREIDRKPVPQQVSMYLYICSKQYKAITAWKYVQYRVESQPEFFLSRNLSISDFRSDEEKYLFNAARKWLITKELLSDFIAHMIDVNNKVIVERRKILERYNRICEREEDISTGEREKAFEAASKTRYTIARIFKDIPARRRGCSFDERELDGASKISAFDYVYFNPMMEPILNFTNYHQWLKEFFLSTITRQIDDIDYLRNALSPNVLEKMIGIDPSFSRRFYELTLVSKEELDSRYKVVPCSDDELFVAYKNARKKVLSGDRSTPKIEISHSMDLRNTGNPISDFCFKVSNSKRIHAWYISNILRECDDIEFSIGALDEFYQIITNYPSDDFFMDHLMYYLFEQNIFHIKYNLDFHNNCIYVIQQPLEFFEKYLIQYLDEKHFVQVGIKGHMALSVLLEKGSLKAIDFLKRLIYSDLPLHKPYNNFPEFELIKLIKNTDGYNYVKSLKFDIGYQWEHLCKRIVGLSFITQIDNENFESMLISGVIPDIVVGENIVFIDGKIKHAPLIIECKKSVYFGDPDILNNATTEKYVHHCDELHYWILEKPSNFIHPNFPKVKFIFLSEICDTYSVPDEIKIEAEKLLELANLSDSATTNLEQMSAKELMAMYEYYSTAQFVVQKKKRKAFKVKHVQSIRKYSMTGKYLAQYRSTTEASENTNISVDSIAGAIAGRRFSAGGFLWRRCDVQDPAGDIEVVKPESLEGKRIFQVSLEGEVLQVFSSVSVASKNTGIDRKSIRDTVHGRQKTAGGFMWQAHSDESEV